jgi:hypothetical protein
MNDAIALVEQRTYLLAAGQTSAYLKLYESEGFALQIEILQHLLGYYSVEVGELNTVVHLWGFSSHAEREARRARLQSSPGWQSYWGKVRPLVLNQRSAFLKPAPFFAQRLQALATAGASLSPLS